MQYILERINKKKTTLCPVWKIPTFSDAHVVALGIVMNIYQLVILVLILHW